MTGREYVAGIPVVDPGAGPYHPGRGRNRAVNVVHAVALPVADNPTGSVCGALVIATVDVRWHETWGVTRCTSCLVVTHSGGDP